MSSSRLRVALGVVFAVGAAGAIAFVVVAAKTQEAQPARCAPGMIPLGPRCCGEGQRLEGGSCRGAPTRCASNLLVTGDGCRAEPRVVEIPGGTLRVGPGDWEAQGVVTPRVVEVAAFAIDAFEVTEARYAACVEERACAAVRLSGEPGRAVAGVTFAEAVSFCQFSRGRVPSSDELAFASASAKGRRYPWGDTGAVCRRAAWGLADGPCGWRAEGPEIAGSHPDGASPEGVFDLAGNVAEWSMGEGGKPETRGGSYADSAANALRSWQRHARAADDRSPTVGIRCVYSAGP